MECRLINMEHVVETYTLRKHNILCNKITSLAASTIAVYSALPKEREIVTCFFVLHEFEACPN